MKLTKNDLAIIFGGRLKTYINFLKRKRDELESNYPKIKKVNDKHHEEWFMIDTRIQGLEKILGEKP